MSDTTTEQMSEVTPLPENIKSVQPGGGKCYSIELAWGKLRRGWLKTFRKGYIAKMAEKRIGSTDGAPHEILDPRDLKYCRNQVSCYWKPEDDPFTSRENIPLARWGLAEAQLMGYPLLALTIGLLFLPSFWKIAALAPFVILFLIIYFFRDPNRKVPEDPQILVSPADGKIAEITELEHDEFIGGPAVRIGIFLSIFNVHINRASSKSKVIEMQYSPGLFLNALNPESAIKNENMWIGFQETESPYRKTIVRQISGLIARRIVCDLKPGQIVDRGFKFGMIKLGSRTELIFPNEPGHEVCVTMGETVKAGSTVLVRFNKNEESN